MILRWVVLGVGAILFVLLLLADKTNLTNKDRLDLDGAGVESVDLVDQINLAPIGNTDLQKKIDIASEAEGQEKAILLDTLVKQLAANREFPYAAKYASELTQLDSSFDKKLQLGLLSFEAAQSSIASGDTVNFRKFSDLAMSTLEGVQEIEPENEVALLYLGLSYMESRLQQNAMRGIRTIRSVLDINPNNVEASRLLGNFSMRTQQWNKAVGRFVKVLSLNPGDHESRLQLALAYYQLGEAENAQKELKIVLAESKNPEVLAAAQQLQSRF
ncbi:MAG: tetratricopeptide repeat protein [Bacteroidota bacterium]